MYLDIIKKCATRNLFDVHLMKNANIKPLHSSNLQGFYYIKPLQIGICKIAIDKNTAILNNLEIHDPYKRNGYGSLFLQEIEKSIQTSHNIKEIGLTAWQSDKDNVSDFFKKNGYHHSNTNSDHYDDSVTQYDLYNMHKIIK